MPTGKPLYFPVGTKIGRLEVIKQLDSRGGNRVFLCRCDCGELAEVRAPNLNSGNSRSCGCLQREAVAHTGRTINRSHGDTTEGNISAEYVAWSSMITRCTNPNADNYKNYGGRGILVCEKWLNSFGVFLGDLGRKPSSKHSLDRYPNTNGNYEPGNCRWATWKEQARNKNNNRMISWKGETKTAAEWAELIGLPYNVFCSRLHMKWDTDRIFTTPLRVRSNTPQWKISMYSSAQLQTPA